MSPSTIAIIGIVLLIILFLLRMPVAYVMALIGFLGFAYASSVEGALRILAKDFWAMFSSYSLTVVPMFVFMGAIAFYSGMSGRLYDTAYKFLGRYRGGLALATIVACAGFGAMCGSTNAGAAAMGKVTLPEMRRYNYDPSLATACVASAGSLAILIPPSTVFIIYGILTQESIGKLFAAGILPGLLLTALFALTIYIICWINPRLAPAGARFTWKERLASLSGVTEMFLLFALVMGGLFIGWFTPTEAGAVGAAGALIIALVRRTLSWQGFLNSLADTTRITAMVFLIVTAATVFGHFMSVTRVPFELSGWVGGLPLSPNVIMGLIIFAYLIGGCFMDSLALITLTVPILFPVVLLLGFDPIWFGVIIVLVAEMGVITPPVGINVYVIKGVAPDVPLETIFKGIFPFLAAIIVCGIIMLFFPQIALFLPGFMVW
ncbi:MAG: C4-dicarboxylate ABC transporter permease [Chloroflexi bacterium RBG_16_50_9]|nr:MAG: C4-dicarboxylate ABC transporter permease [Chloroflexi bacterium RBG_16_50_9]